MQKDSDNSLSLSKRNELSLPVKSQLVLISHFVSQYIGSFYQAAVFSLSFLMRLYSSFTNFFVSLLNCGVVKAQQAKFLFTRQVNVWDFDKYIRQTINMKAMFTSTVVTNSSS